MATGGAEDDTDLYTCQVCLEDQTKRIPRLLSCHHSFCQDCIKNLVKEGKVECPTCRKLTLIADDDVAELSMNFMLMKMKEHVDKLVQNKQCLCQVCGVTAADKKCRECTHLLCDPCIVKHGKYEGFKDHQILPVCPKHPQGLLNHFCMKCIKGVCSICLMNDHDSHKEAIVDYREGMCKIKKNLEEMKTNLRKKLPTINQEKAKCEELLSETKIIEQNLQGLYESYLKKSQEVSNIIEKLKVHCSRMESLLDHQNDAEMVSKEFTECLSKADVTISNCYPNLKLKAQEILTRDESSIVLKEFSEFISHLQALQILKNNENEIAPGTVQIEQKKACFITNLVYNDPLGSSILHPMIIQCIKPTMVAVFDMISRKYVSIEITGGCFNPNTRYFNFHSDNNYALYKNNHLWFVVDKNIEQYPWPCGLQVIDQDTNLKRISKIFNGIPPKLVVYDNVLKRVYEYCDQKLKKVLSEVTVDHICVQTANNVPIGYVVTDTFNNKLTLYNTVWVHQKVLNIPEVKGPSGCVSTPMGLLVANTGNNCITLLDNQGELAEECVVGEKEGIRRPVGIDYMEPYLWIAEYDKYQGHRSIKCFELQPNP